MGRRREDEKMVPGKDEDPPSRSPQEESMGSRVEDEKMFPEKDEDAPHLAPQDQEEAIIRRGEDEKDEKMLPEKGEDAPSDSPQDQNQEAMESRSKDEKMMPEKDEDPPSHAPQVQGQGQDQALSAEEARGEDQKDKDAPSKTPQGQNQEKVRRSPRLSMGQGQPVLQGHDKEPSKKRQYSGISKKGDKWTARIGVGKGKRDWLGRHHTEEEAALAFDRGARKHGRFKMEPNFPRLNFPEPSEEMLGRVFKNDVKKTRSKRQPAKHHPLIPFTARHDLPSSSKRHAPKPCPPIPHPAQPDLPSSSARRAAKPGPAVGRAREADRESKTSSSAWLQEKLNQYMEPLLMMLKMFVDDIMQERPCASLIELVQVFVRCISRINHLAHLYQKSQWEPALLAVNYPKKCQHEFARALCSVTRHRLEELRGKRDLKRACSKKRPANPDLPSTSTAVVSEEQYSDAESSIETREAFREKNLSSSWQHEKLTQVLAPLLKVLLKFGRDLMQESAGAILKELVKTFINCISRARSLAQRFDTALGESGLEAIIYARGSQHEFAVELASIMSEQLGVRYPSLQPMDQGNSVNQPPLVMHQSSIREHTNDANMRDRPSTSAGVVANIEAVRSHQNATNAGHRGIPVASVTQELVALQEKQHDREIDIIEALLSLSAFQERENNSESEE